MGDWRIQCPGGSGHINGSEEIRTPAKFVREANDHRSLRWRHFLEKRITRCWPPGGRTGIEAETENPQFRILRSQNLEGLNG